MSEDKIPISVDDTDEISTISIYSTVESNLHGNEEFHGDTYQQIPEFYQRINLRQLANQRTNEHQKDFGYTTQNIMLYISPKTHY